MYHFPPKEISRSGSFTREFNQTCKELTLILHNSFQNLEGEGMHPGSFHGASVTLVPKPDKDNKKGMICHFPLRADPKFHTQIQGNSTIVYLKTSHLDHVRFIVGMQSSLTISKSINVIHHI